MSWSHVYQPWTGPLLLPAFKIQSFGVDGHGTDPCADGAKSRRRSGVPRFLHPHWFFWVEHQMGCAVERLLDTGDDEHLLGRTLNSTGDIQILSHCVAQRAISQSFAAGQQICRDAPQSPACHLGPKIGGKNVERRLTASKCSRRPRLRSRQRRQPARVRRK